MISVILVQPQKAGNIGSICRVMKNFGFSELILVDPCELNRDAEIMAVHAKDILHKAKIYKTFKNVAKNFDLLIGTTAISTTKDDYFLRISLSPTELKEKLSSAKGKIGLVFGREDFGLSNEELSSCDFCITIPTSKEYKSMNISHAVAILLYEVANVKSSAKPRLANKKELYLIKRNIADISEKIDYPKAEKRKVFNTMIDKLVGRALITGREANTIIGVLKKIKSKIKE